MRWSYCVVLSLIALPLWAQEPAGPVPDYAVIDPDSIYRLAVDSLDYPEDDYVLLFDDGVLVYEADGRGRETYRQIIQVLTRDGARSMGERSYSYLKGREGLTVDWIRVVTPEGELIADGPSHQQESTARVSTDYPVYTDRVVKRLSVGGLEPGTILDVSYTREILEPPLKGDFSSSWRVNPPVPTLRSRLILDVPDSLRPHIREDNLNFERRELVRGARRIYIWATAEVERWEPEPFTGWPDNGSMTIRISGPLGWEDVAHWYAGLARDRYELTPDIETKLAQVVAGAGSQDDSLRAAYEWVQQEFRYVSLSLGLGGYQPRPPAEVFHTKLGDCKDKATLFIALAERMGVTAYPVLISPAEGADSLLPSISEFNHAIAAVQRPDDYLYLDLTAEGIPYGYVPPSLQGSFGLLVRPDGHGEPLVLPRDPPDKNRREVLLRGELSADGVFTGTYTTSLYGAESYEIHSLAERYAQLSERQREQLNRQIANSVFPGASGEEFTIRGAADAETAAGVSIELRAPGTTSRAGRSYIFTLPLPNYANPALIDELEATPRKHSIDVGQVIGSTVATSTLEMTLPEGWRADLPPETEASSSFGRYAARYVQEGRRLRVSRELGGRRGTLPAESVAELIDWLRAISQDNVPYIVLTPPEE